MQNGKVRTEKLATGATGATRSPPAPRAPGVGRLIWDFWKAYAEKIAFYQTTVILGAIYVVVVGPIWAIGRLSGHQFLPLLPKAAPSFWHPAHMGRVAAIDELKKQG